MSVQLVSSDGKTITVQRDIITQSELLTNMLRDLGFEAGQDVADPIPLTKITSQILQKVIQWCEKHKDDEPYLDRSETDNHSPDQFKLPEWDEQFLKVMGQVDLFDTIQAANYLNIKKLLDYACLAVAGMIAGKEPDAIRKQFNITDDFTDEERARAAAENQPFPTQP